jgi:hypothetical protein
VFFSNTYSVKIRVDGQKDIFCDAFLPYLPCMLFAGCNNQTKERTEKLHKVFYFVFL